VRAGYYKKERSWLDASGSFLLSIYLAEIKRTMLFFPWVISSQEPILKMPNSKQGWWNGRALV
jgi:hypothetical protein